MQCCGNQSHSGFVPRRSFSNRVSETNTRCRLRPAFLVLVVPCPLFKSPCQTASADRWISVINCFLIMFLAASPMAKSAGNHNSDKPTPCHCFFARFFTGTTRRSFWVVVLKLAAIFSARLARSPFAALRLEDPRSTWGEFAGVAARRAEPDVGTTRPAATSARTHRNTGARIECRPRPHAGPNGRGRQGAHHPRVHSPLRTD